VDLDVSTQDFNGIPVDRLVKPSHQTVIEHHQPQTQRHRHGNDQGSLAR
jgi:hypothetical protein